MESKSESQIEIVQLEDIYKQIKANDEIHKRIDISMLEEMLEQGVNPPNIEKYDDLPKDDVIETKSVLTKPLKPWLINKEVNQETTDNQNDNL